jgi:hypothetical protein
MRFILLRATARAAFEAAVPWDAKLLRRGEALNWAALAPHTCHVIALLDEPLAAPSSAHAAASTQR